MVHITLHQIRMPLSMGSVTSGGNLRGPDQRRLRNLLFAWGAKEEGIILFGYFFNQKNYQQGRLPEILIVWLLENYSLGLQVHVVFRDSTKIYYMFFSVLWLAHLLLTSVYFC